MTETTQSASIVAVNSRCPQRLGSSAAPPKKLAANSGPSRAGNGRREAAHETIMRFGQKQIIPSLPRASAGKCKHLAQTFRGCSVVLASLFHLYTCCLSKDKQRHSIGISSLCCDPALPNFPSLKFAAAKAMRLTQQLGYSWHDA